jgi:hypothetical protein
MATAKERGLMPDGVGQDMTGTSMLGLAGIQIGSSDDGKEYALSLVTVDNLHLRFLLNSNVAIALAEGMVAALAKHSI